MGTWLKQKRHKHSALRPWRRSLTSRGNSREGSLGADEGAEASNAHFTHLVAFAGHHLFKPDEVAVLFWRSVQSCGLTLRGQQCFSEDAFVNNIFASSPLVSIRILVKCV